MKYEVKVVVCFTKEVEAASEAEAENMAFAIFGQWARWDFRYCDGPDVELKQRNLALLTRPTGVS